MLHQHYQLRKYESDLSITEHYSSRGENRACAGFKPRTSAIPVQCSTNQVDKSTGSWSFCEFQINPLIYENLLCELQIKE